MDSIKKGIPKKDVKDISTNNEKPKIMSSIEILKMGSGDTSNNNPYEKVPLGNIKVGEGNEEETESIDLTDEEESEEIEKIEVEEAEELEEEIEKQIPTEGLLDIKELDFTRIATTAKDAKNGNFIKVGHPEYWGDSGELNYKIVDGAVYIYEGETILGFTDLQGIGKETTEEIENIETEEVEELEEDEEEVFEDPVDEIEIIEPMPSETEEPVKNPIPEVEATIIDPPEKPKHNIENVMGNIKTYELEISNDIAREAYKRGWSQDLIDLAVAISRYETGDYQDYKAAKYYNYGGLRGGKGVKPIKYSTGRFALFGSQEDGIEAFLNTLQSYFESGRTTPEKIVTKYCPASDGNDEAHWVKSVYGKME